MSTPTPQQETSRACCFDDLGGVPRELLTDRDPAFCIGRTSDGTAILAPEWVDLCRLLGVVPKACRSYRAKTKGKVERMVRELKESFLPWLTGHDAVQQLTHRPAPFASGPDGSDRPGSLDVGAGMS